jgi:hypothetical protein
MLLRKQRTQRTCQVGQISPGVLGKGEQEARGDSRESCVSQFSKRVVRVLCTPHALSSATYQTVSMQMVKKMNLWVSTSPVWPPAPLLTAILCWQLYNSSVFFNCNVEMIISTSQCCEFSHAEAWRAQGSYLINAVFKQAILISQEGYWHVAFYNLI